MNTLRGKITAITLIIIAFLFLLVGVLQYTFMKDFLYNNKAESLHAQIRTWPPEPFFLRGDIQPDNHEPGGNRPDRSIIFQPGMIVSYVDQEGQQTLLSDTNSELAPIISTEQYPQIFEQYDNRNKKQFYVFSDVEGNDYMVVFRDAGSRGVPSKLLQVSIELQSLQAQLFTQLAIYISVALVALIAGTVLMLFSLRKALRPLNDMIQTVERTNAENLTEQLPRMQQQELQQLADAYNNMLARLETSFDSERLTSERMRQFIADASHELRTPITSIHGFIEVLQRGAMLQPKQLELSLKAMEQESTRMKTLVENLLQLAKLDHIDNESMFDELTPVELTSLLKSMQLQLELMAGQRTVQLKYSEADSYTILGSKHGLKQVILNLTNNAIQHTDASNGHIVINLKRNPEHIILSISDNGVGIAKEHQQHLFERFFRIDKARTRTSGGAGLGLSITKSIIDAHQGRIEVDSELGMGTTFTIHFPL